MHFTPLIKTLALSAALSTTLIVAPGLASAQNNYPSRPVTIIVPAPAGGGIDLIARVVGEKLSVKFGQPFIVENRPGASNNLGTAVLANAKPDGYTIGIVGGSHNINKFLFKNLGWDPQKSFEPIVYTHEIPLVFAIYPKLPVKTMPELVTWMKANPGEAKVATSGRGSAQEMAAEMFRMVSGAPVLLVPYKGSSAAHPDLVAGRTALYIDTISAIQEQVKAGNVRAVAVSTRNRSKALPNVPTAEEQGLKGYDANTNGGFLAPAGTPKEIVAKLSAELKAALADPTVQQKMLGAGTVASYMPPDQLATRMRNDYAKWGKVIKDNNIKSD